LTGFFILAGMGKGDFNIVFMGTADFAVPSLEALINSDYKVVGVVTAPDKEAGRGQKLSQSPVKTFASSKILQILQPVNLKDQGFQSQLQEMKPDLQVVVAFRMLPREVWAMPTKGTVNLHASLLPQYRGAAPINHAIMNGETTTGLTTFFIDEKIDTGNIIKQTAIDIGEDETFGELYDRLKKLSAGFLLDTVDEIYHGTFQTMHQDELRADEGQLKPAPKIFRDDCAIDFTRPLMEVHNFIRGLSPYPAAFTTLHDGEKQHLVKIYRTHAERADHSFIPGTILTDDKQSLLVAVPGGWLHILELQLAGKRKLSASEFRNGYQLSSGARFGEVSG
jgi:methionyl-tRNA formyltransferase